MADSSLSQPSQAHWQQVSERINEAFQGSRRRPVILSSWQRSQDAGLLRSTPEPLLQKVSKPQLRGCLERSTALLQVASPLMQRCSESLSGVRHVLYIVDASGVVLHSCGDAIWRAVHGLMPGYIWAENVMGTNGAGTALATDSPVAVIGPEHYRTEFTNTTCMAAPIHDCNGAMVGAVDLSTSVEDARPEHMRAVVELAAEIEANLQPAG